MSLVPIFSLQARPTLRRELVTQSVKKLKASRSHPQPRPQNTHTSALECQFVYLNLKLGLRLILHCCTTDSEISNDSDYDPTQESLAERISALRDIVPPTTRAWFWNKFQTTQRVVKGVIFFAGRSMWSISVSALLIGVPFALCWAEEQQVIAMEQEARMREMGADVLTAGGGEGGTADRVGQALGKEGGVETKAAGL